MDIGTSWRDSIDYKRLTAESIETPDCYGKKDASLPRAFATFSLKTIAVFDYLMHFFSAYPKTRFPAETLDSLYGPAAIGGESNYTNDAQLKEELAEKLKSPAIRYKLKPESR